MARTRSSITVATKKGNPPSSIAATVFAIPELLELILLDLEIFDLVRCNCVWHEWRSSIASSTKVLRKLFLSPEPVSEDDNEKRLLDWSRTWMGDEIWGDTATDHNTKCRYVALRELSVW